MVNICAGFLVWFLADASDAFAFPSSLPFAFLRLLLNLVPPFVSTGFSSRYRSLPVRFLARVGLLPDCLRFVTITTLRYTCGSACRVNRLQRFILLVSRLPRGLPCSNLLRSFGFPLFRTSGSRFVRFLTYPCFPSRSLRNAPSLLAALLPCRWLSRFLRVPDLPSSLQHFVGGTLVRCSRSLARAAALALVAYNWNVSCLSFSDITGSASRFGFSV